MEYQKIINLLDNAPNQPSKFRGEMGWNKWYLVGRYSPDSAINSRR